MGSARVWKHTSFSVSSIMGAWCSMWRTPSIFVRLIRILCLQFHKTHTFYLGMIWTMYLQCTTKCHCQWPLHSKLGKHPQQEVSLYAVCQSISYFPSKVSQSSLTSLWLAQMLLNGMPSSKCSQNIVWTIQPWLQCRDHNSKWYLAGTV